ANADEIQAQRKACVSLRFPTLAYSASYEGNEYSVKAQTKAQTNCLMAVQPSVEWVRASLRGDNTFALTVLPNNTPRARSATLRVATPHASFVVEVKQAANPSEFLPL